MSQGILKLVQESAKKRILFLPHAIRQMSAPERMIITKEVRGIVDSGEVIENYPEDPRGSSCLLLGHGENNRPIHVVCSPKTDYLAITTAYMPHKDEWEKGFYKRRGL